MYLYAVDHVAHMIFKIWGPTFSLKEEGIFEVQAMESTQCHTEKLDEEGEKNKELKILAGRQWLQLFRIISGPRKLQKQT